MTFTISAAPSQTVQSFCFFLLEIRFEIGHYSFQHAKYGNKWIKHYMN